MWSAIGRDGVFYPREIELNHIDSGPPGDLDLDLLSRFEDSTEPDETAKAEIPAA